MHSIIAISAAFMIAGALSVQAAPASSTSPFRQAAQPSATQSLTRQPVERPRTNAERRTAPEQDYAPWHVKPNRQADRPWHCGPDTDPDCEE